MMSALGTSLAQHQRALSENKSGISLHSFDYGDYFIGKIPEESFQYARDQWNFPSSFSKAESLTAISIHEAWQSANEMTNIEDAQLFLASTKGNIDLINDYQGNKNSNVHFISLVNKIQTHFKFNKKPILVCNACTSGLMAIIMATRLIKSKKIKKAIVCGVDIISEFTLRGFSALHAMDDKPCRPFDESRGGTTLGEGCATVVISDSAKGAVVEIVNGASGNDANHISGPSRTGAGLQQAIKNAMVDHDNIGFDYINAHGTATRYNDEMEAQAFHARGFHEVPVHSLKGYWGHTLGAAGLLETIAATFCMADGLIYKSIGYDKHGLTLPLNVVEENRRVPIQTCLKTSSGFGGSNSALILKRLA